MKMLMRYCLPAHRPSIGSTLRSIDGPQRLGSAHQEQGRGELQDQRSDLEFLLASWKLPKWHPKMECHRFATDFRLFLGFRRLDPSSWRVFHQVQEPV